MPLYEYTCSQCGNIEEHLHSHNEEPQFVCECGFHMERFFSTFAISNGICSEQKEVMEKTKRRRDMKVDLRDNHGIEQMSLQGKTLEETYKDVKKNSSSIAEKFAQNSEQNQDKQRKKQKEWMRGALARTEKRRIEKKKMRQKEGLDKPK